MKIATWNLNSIKIRLQHLLDFIDSEDPDILLLQEIKCENLKFPYEELSHLPYNIYVNGQKSYHGVAILSKFVADEVTMDFTANPSINEARFLEISCNIKNIGFCRIISLYAPNGGEVGSEKFINKLKFYDALIDYLNSKKIMDEKLIIGGDFNIAPFDIDLYSPKDLENSTCCTYEEKEKIRILLNSDFHDLYRFVNHNKQEFSWWDYRAGSFEKNHGLRLDMLLASSNFVQNFKNCYMDYNMRSNYKPSDHIAVIAS